jgi:hypothetical protein
MYKPLPPTRHLLTPGRSKRCRRRRETVGGSAAANIQLALVLCLLLRRELGVDLSGGRVRAQRSSEKQNMGLGLSKS